MLAVAILKFSVCFRLFGMDPTNDLAAGPGLGSMEWGVGWESRKGPTCIWCADQRRWTPPWEARRLHLARTLRRKATCAF